MVTVFIRWILTCVIGAALRWLDKDRQADPMPWWAYMNRSLTITHHIMYKVMAQKKVGSVMMHNGCVHIGKHIALLSNISYIDHQ